MTAWRIGKAVLHGVLRRPDGRLLGRLDRLLPTAFLFTSRCEIVYTVPLFSVRQQFQFPGQGTHFSCFDTRARSKAYTTNNLVAVRAFHILVLLHKYIIPVEKSYVKATSFGHSYVLLH